MATVYGRCFNLYKLFLLSMVPGLGLWAGPPETVNIHGSLVDSGGNPLAGVRACLVRFYDAEVYGAQLGGDLTVTVAVSSGGLFNLPVVLSPEVLAADEVWYTLGIDTDAPPDGNAEDDFFPERIRVHSVPFALEAGTVVQVDAGSVGEGRVDNTEFGHLDGVIHPLQAAIDAKAETVALSAHESDTANPHAVTAVQVGLGTVDNTADMDKPVSAATQTALNTKAAAVDLTAHENNTNNPHAVMAVQVGLGSVDNTSDLAKPVSTATKAALDAKANSVTLTEHTGNISNPHGVTKAQVGLGNAENTADLDKPVSTAAQIVLNTKTNLTLFAAHANNESNPHAVTKAQVGLNAVDNTSDTDKPVSTAVQAALNDKLPRTSEACIVVETASDAVTNGTNLLAAYAAARALTPLGAPLSVTNRAVVLVPPGNYDLNGASLTMDTDYVDLVGLSTAREEQHIYSSGNVLFQTAGDIHIENLVLHYIGTELGIHAYYPYVEWVDGGDHKGSPPATRIRNCEFRAIEHSMSISEYAGVYEDCTAEGSYAFGGGATGIASGTFINCKCGDDSYGGGTASGSFTNCTGGDNAFGGVSGGIASGTFINCTGGMYAFGGMTGVVNGTFTNCTGTIGAFGGFDSVASGTFTHCTGGDYAFGGYKATASGSFIHCTGGQYAFGGGGAATDGKFYHCIGGADSFTTNGAPTVIYCIRDGVAYP